MRVPKWNSKPKSSKGKDAVKYVVRGNEDGDDSDEGDNAAGGYTELKSSSKAGANSQPPSTPSHSIYRAAVVWCWSSRAIPPSPDAATHS